MKLVYSTYASEQLENILYFLTNEQGVSFEKAFEIRQKILDKADLLLVNPKLGRKTNTLINFCCSIGD
jgi:plasmid stabilization system protein ParE